MARRLAVRVIRSARGIPKVIPNRHVQGQNGFPPDGLAPRLNRKPPLRGVVAQVLAAGVTGDGAASGMMRTADLPSTRSAPTGCTRASCTDGTVHCTDGTRCA